MDRLHRMAKLIVPSRDLMTDVFDALLVARQVVLDGHEATAFPLIRRAFESNSLLAYFVWNPKKAEEWNDGKQISNGEIRKFIEAQPTAVSLEAIRMKDHYALYSEAAHPNRGFVPIRWLGEGNRFVLGATPAPDVRLVRDYLYEILGLWFMLSANLFYRFAKIFKSDKRLIETYFFVTEIGQKVKEAAGEREIIEDHAPPGHCQRCEHDLAGQESGVCPECGTALKPPGDK